MPLLRFAKLSISTSFYISLQHLSIKQWLDICLVIRFSTEGVSWASQQNATHDLMYTYVTACMYMLCNLLEVEVYCPVDLSDRTHACNSKQELFIVLLVVSPW